nr:MAG: baculoviral IAP repeat-containing protein [Marsupenaeus japonicus endogenous nimavirus]
MDQNYLIKVSRVISYDDLRYEFNRILTFTKWPKEWLSALKLASDGFFYLEEEESCQNQDNVPLMHRDFSSIRFNNFNYTDDFQPIYTEYISSQRRLDSYKNWSKESIQNPVHLSEAGFIADGVSDSVFCFYCGIYLIGWRKNDIPWNEHALWNPCCPYVRMVKSEKFIKEVYDKWYKMEPTSSGDCETQFTDTERMDYDISRQVVQTGYPLYCTRKSPTNNCLSFNDNIYSTSLFNFIQSVLLKTKDKFCKKVK